MVDRSHVDVLRPIEYLLERYCNGKRQVSPRAGRGGRSSVDGALAVRQRAGGPQCRRDLGAVAGVAVKVDDIGRRRILNKTGGRSNDLGLEQGIYVSEI